MIKFCKKCHDEKKIRYWGDKYGYLWTLTDDAKICPDCQSNLVDIDFPALDLKILEKISDSTDFYDAMIKLHDEDIIEYELKMSQFRSQVEQINDIKQQSNIPHCPTCDSTNIEKISLTKKAAGAFGFGLFSKTAKSQFHCKDCGYKW